MPNMITKEVLPGTPTILESTCADSHHAVVFEDDGETGYFYALRVTRAESVILDAVHVYNVKDFADSGGYREVSIHWDTSGSRVGLRLAGQLFAAFDFEFQRGMCRSGFPPVSQWSESGHDWDARLAESLAGDT